MLWVPYGMEAPIGKASDVSRVSFMVKGKIEMKTTAVLTRIIPTLNAVRGSGAFNVVIAGLAAPITEELRVAANDDLLSATALLGALAKLAAAKEFETQQAAMAEVILFADRLLGEIVAGTAPRADRISLTARDLVKRIAADVDSIRDVYAPSAEVLSRIRRDASEMASLIDAEIIERARPEDHATYAAIVFDQADRLFDSGHSGREKAGEVITKNIQLLAA